MIRNYINIYHIVLCLVLQGFGYALTGNPFIGAVAGIFFYFGREVAQAEYRNIQASASKMRKDMGALGGFNFKYWTLKSLLGDWLIPSVIVILGAILIY